jgi:hypothetical protein
VLCLVVLDSENAEDAEDAEGRRDPLRGFIFVILFG